MLTGKRGGLIRFARRLKYFGLKHRCPFCKGWLRKFQAFGIDVPVLRDAGVVGAGWRPDALCPICASLDRERLLYLFLESRTAIFREPLRILHVAPEGHLAIALRRNANLSYTTADLAAPGVMVRMDVTRLPFASSSFDAILCSHVLEHVPNDAQAMQELWRVLRPRGWALLQVPIGASLRGTVEDPSVSSPSERERVFGQADHVRIYEAHDYTGRLTAAGFSVDAIPSVDALGLDRVHRYGVSPNEAVFYCTKPV